MRLNKKLLLGIAIVCVSIFGFAKSAESPAEKAAIEVKQISETSTEK
ncbi:hypothetical protein [Fictibacillus barbaricus]|uniref:Uncharacterized protein n=1 Tax=Fictibacillus barbaricus TaxID=182136 RepID=A0ABU1TWS8_9BACL|nr:hypothetical protein [Fictibacillus barbaricus]MDR7071662.1 hypothetical protein [Fictibacillus barbaricus]